MTSIRMATLHTTIALLVFLIKCPALFAVGNPVVTGSIARGTDVNTFTVKVKVPKVANTNLGSGETSLFKRLKFYLPGTDTNDPIPFEGQAAVSGLDFTVRESGTMSSAANDTFYDLTFSAQISGTTSTALKTLLNSTTSLLLRVKYYEGDTLLGDSENTTISISTKIVAAAPQAVIIKPEFRGIGAYFLPNTTAVFSDGSTDDVNDVTLVVIADSATRTDLPAMTYSNSTTTSDTSASEDTCVFNKSYNDGEDCTSCASSTTNYLNTEALANLESQGIYVRSGTPSAGKIGISGLTIGQTYHAFLYYEPGGLTRSVCYRAIPYKNSTSAELAGEGDASEDNPRCFIATAAYGSSMHKNIGLFKWFRDKVLLKFNAGKSFVDWYYTVGPKGAEIVAAYPALAGGVRAILWIPALLLSLWISILHGSAAAISVLVLGIGTVVAVMLKRRNF